MTARQDSIIDELSAVAKFTSHTVSNEEMGLAFGGQKKDLTLDGAKTRNSTFGAKPDILDHSFCPTRYGRLSRTQR
ncbi:MAG: hypothetical protein AAF393_06345 [Pseudomonadota bacterium]